MDEISFKSLNELYTRLYPLKEQNINVKEIDIWNYLKENVWPYDTNLNIYDMVNDIFEIDSEKMKDYLDKKGSV